jgi:hypothetical protein
MAAGGRCTYVNCTQEARMYIGGGLITLIVVILLLAWLL